MECGFTIITDRVYIDREIDKAIGCESSLRPQRDEVKAKMLQCLQCIAVVAMEGRGECPPETSPPK